MELQVEVGDISRCAADAIIVNLFEGVRAPGGATGAVDAALEGAISQLIAAGEIRGKLHETTLIHALGKLPAPRVLVAGLGKAQEFDLDRVRSVTAVACRALRAVGARSIASIAHGAGIGGMDPAASAQAMAEGALLGLYRFRRHFTVDKDDDQREVERLTLVERARTKVAPMEEGLRQGRVLAEAAILARDMVNEPANIMTPTQMAQTAREMAQRCGLECAVFDRSQMEEMGMGCLLAVAAGSQQPPKFIVLKYTAADADPQRPALGLAGKGITFDSGGISLKPPEGMGEMKSDMAGGAAVIAALQAIAQLKPRLNVVGLVPATENLPSGSAVKPADVVRALSGKTVEVANTDAEGRLILADALAYGNRLGLSPILDVATLTGAMRVALGTVRTGYFATDDRVAQALEQAAGRSGERIWRLPLDQEYREQIKSEVADVKNSGGRPAGAIAAAQFLHEFAEDTPWAHLDIAGTAFADKEKGYVVKGATGVPVRTLVHFALLWAEQK